MSKNARRAVIGLVTALLLTLVPPVAHAAVTGSLSQLPVPNDCIQNKSISFDECGNKTGVGIEFPNDIAISPNGKFAYVADGGSEAILVFARNADGSLTQLTGAAGCLGEHGTFSCGSATTFGLQSPQAIIVSPDGKNVYVAGQESGYGAIAEFAVNSDGSLTQLKGSDNCIEESGGTGCGTTTGHGIVSPTRLVITPDGKNVYVADTGGGSQDQGAVAEFTRDPSTGALSQLGCIVETQTSPSTECGASGHGLQSLNAIVVSSDNKNVYTGERNTPGAIAEFARSPVDGSLTELGCVGATSGTECLTNSAIGINDIRGMDLSPDGRNLYSVSFDYLDAPIAEFSRDAKTGLLAQLSSPNDCIEEHDVSKPVGCGNQTGHGLGSAFDIKVSPDGQSAYVVGNSRNALVELARNSDGSLTQLASPNDCIQEPPQPSSIDCGNTSGRGLGAPVALAMSPDSANVYVAADGCLDPCVSAIAEFARVVPPPPPSTPTPTSTTTPASTPAPPGKPPAKTAVKATKKKKHHKKKHHKKVRAKRVIRPAPSFTG